MLKNKVSIFLLTVGLILNSVNIQAQEIDLSETELQQVHCLAQNIYFEARNQSVAGQFAVGLVTRNRVNDPRFKSTICKVVKRAKLDADGTPIKNKCTFSWYCDGLPDIIGNEEAYDNAFTIAYLIYKNWDTIYDFTEGATHYHSVKVHPWWAPSKEFVVQIDDHLFYRWG